MDIALEHRPGTAYDEDAFLHFLAIERARAARSHHALRLVLATLEPVAGKPVPIGPTCATRFFEGLRLSLRETDVMGWYRQHRVAGAVLSERAGAPGSDDHADPPESEVSRVIQQRVGEALRQRLPSRVARSLRIQVIQLGPRVGSR